MDTSNKIKGLLAEYIGVETEDINENDELQHDLHMSPSDVTDFLISLEAEGWDISKLDMAEMKSVEDLVETLNFQEGL